jgi:hypothetical protein
VPTTPPSVHIFVRTGTAGPWQLQDTLQLQPTGLLGTVLALSGNGDTLAIGHPEDDGPNGDRADSGVVIIYERTDDTWSEVRPLRDSQGEAGILYGAALAFSGDATQLAIGVPGKLNSGRVHLLTRAATGWAAPATVHVLSLPDAQAGDGGGAFFGSALAMSEAGDRLAIGASERLQDVAGVPTRTGAVYVYGATAGGTWRFESGTLRGTVAGVEGGFGAVLALARDGNRLAVSPPPRHPNPRVDVFTRTDAGVWSASTSIEAPDSAAGTRFGASLSLLDQGAFVTLAVGAPTQQPGNVPGAVHVFSLIDGQWRAQPGSFKSPNTASPGSEFGSSLLLPDSSTLLIGAPEETGNQILSGALYVH